MLVTFQHFFSKTVFSGAEFLPKGPDAFEQIVSS